MLTIRRQPEISREIIVGSSRYPELLIHHTQFGFRGSPVEARLRILGTELPSKPYASPPDGGNRQHCHWSKGQANTYWHKARNNARCGSEGCDPWIEDRLRPPEIHPKLMRTEKQRTNICTQLPQPR
jgi:hypothetical protein